MIISDKSHDANRQNAQHSSGPASPEGKAAVRLNALTYGLRARSTIIDGEDPEEYKRLWANLEAEWQPQTCTERMYLEQMSTSQWLLARIARGESRIYEANIRPEEQFPLLREVSRQRTSLERSFTSALRELKQLQKERQARQPQPAQAVPSPQPPAPRPGERSSPQAPPPSYVMSDAAEAHPGFGAPATTDTR
jgi:hypothetical protein